MKDIKEATETELKAEAFDVQVLMSQLQNKLNIILQELDNRRKAPKPKEVDSVELPRENID